MRWFPLCLGLTCALGAQVSFHVVAVERRGPPPYEQADRVYVLDGGRARGLHVGERLIVRRPGDVRPLGHLRVSEIRDDRSDARFEATGTAYPMKGDLALREELRLLPATSGPDPEPLPKTTIPHPMIEAPPREGLLYFLPQRSDLSPAGLKKLEAWVQEWGREGRWALQIPAARAIKPALQKQRSEALQGALRSLGVAHITVGHEPRTAEGKYDPAWIRHWD